MLTRDERRYFVRGRDSFGEVRHLLRYSCDTRKNGSSAIESSKLVSVRQSNDSFFFLVFPLFLCDFRIRLVNDWIVFGLRLSLGKFGSRVLFSRASCTHMQQIHN